MTTRRPALAKVSMPRLFGIVERARLFARLDDNRGRPLIWIEGPPGAGKTTLAASYLEARRVPALWYQVDPGDADPANLFHYLETAAARLLDIDAVALPRLVPEHVADLPAFARAFFRELFARLPAGAVLVFDNYQEVAEAAPLHEIVRAAAGEVPPGSSVVGISRAEPPGWFAQLAGSGMLASLRWEALRLTLEETRAIAAARDVREDWLVRALHQQSEGWAAGITLMLERLGHPEADARELPTDTRESVFDYFASLLFDQSPARDRETLLALAFLPHASAAMAERLSGSAEAGALLDTLYRRHLFTDRRPGPEPVYQFHALFQDFLQRRAAEAMTPGEVRGLMTRSAEALVDIGNVEAAIDLCVAVQDWERAANLVLHEASGLIKSARWQTLERWIRALPSQAEETTPALLYWLGVAQAQVDPALGLATLLRARDALSRAGDRDNRVRCLAALLNVALLGHAAIPVADAWLGELIEEVEAGLPAAVSMELPVWSALAALLVFWRPWHPLASDARQRVQSLLRQEEDASVALAAAATALVSDVATGNLEAADEVVALIEPVAQRPGVSPSARAWFLYGVAYLRFVQTRYEASLRYFDLAIDAASVSGLTDTLSDIRLYRVMVEFRACGWSVASATLRKLEEQALPKRPMSLALLRVYQARRAHFHGCWAEAAELAMRTQDAIGRVGAPHHVQTFALFNAEILIGAGRFADARPLLERADEILARSPVLDCWRAAAAFCAAFLAHAEGRRDLALELLAQALALAAEGERKYYLRYFECSMPPLFGLALEHGIQVALVQRLIGMFRLKAPADAPDRWPRPVHIRTLGRFEVSVNGQPLEFERKIPKKTLALLKALIACRSEAVPEQWLCDSLWGDEEADAARQVLGVTVLRLRKLLGSDEAVGQQGGKVWLDRHTCWVDAWRFEARLEELSKSHAPGDALDLYGGGFLVEDEGEMWTVATRERLRGKFIHTLAAYGEALESADRVEEAIRLYLRGIDADMVVETFHRGLMRCYRQAGRLTEAVSAYRRLRQTLSAVLGVPPSEESEALQQEIVRELAATQATRQRLSS